MAITISATAAATATSVQGVKLANQSTAALGGAISELLESVEQVAEQGAARVQAASANPALGNRVDVTA